MSLIVSTSSSTYGDGTGTSGPNGIYVLAQFPGDANLDWVMDTRKLLARAELKWKDFEPNLLYIKSKADLWQAIGRSMRSATIVVIDPKDSSDAVLNKYLAEGASLGVDFTLKDIADQSATAIVRNTPVAFLPNSLSEAMGRYGEGLFQKFDAFLPESIKSAIGGKLRDAKIFAARAHATFDYEDLSSIRTTRDTFRSPVVLLTIRELISVHRGFDEEHPKSIQVLNDASHLMATALEEALGTSSGFAEYPLVKEYNSRNLDALQAADVAAGWSLHLLTLGDMNAVCDKFRRVIRNGVVSA